MHSWDNKATNGFAAVLAACFTLAHTGMVVAAASPTGPASVDVGPIAITPTLGVESKHRSNIYLQEDDETSSWIFLMRPALTAKAQDRNNYYSLAYDGEVAWYEEDERGNENDYFDHTLSADAYIDYNQFWTFTAFGSFAMLHEDRGTGVTEGNIGNAVTEPVEYDQADISGSAEYGSQRDIGRVLIEAGYMDRQYQNFRQLTRSRDRDELTLDLTFFYPIAPKTDVFASYGYKDIGYPNTFETLPALDSKEHEFTGGVEWEISPNLTSSAEGGYLTKRFEDSGRGDFKGVTWMLDLWIQPRDRDLIVIAGRRGSDETSLQGDFIRRQEISVDWTHDWSERVSTNLRGSVGNDKYEGSFNDREDDVYNASFRIDYEFRRWANVYTGYSWDEKDSNADNLSYTDNTFIIGVDLSL